MPPVAAAPLIPEPPDIGGFQMEWDRALGQGTLGVGVQELSGDLPEYFGVKDGVLVSSVRKDSPAEKAGVRPGDVITEVNGQAVESASELRRRLRETEPGDVTLSVMRDRKPLSLKATIEAPDRQSLRRPRWTA
jgi:serine protease Do